MVWSLAARAGIAGARRYGLPAIRAAVNWLRKSRADKGITVFRGEPWKASSAALKDISKRFYGPEGISPHSLRLKASGRWFTDKPEFATRFAGYLGPFSGKGRIRKVVLSPKEIRLAKKLSRKIHEGAGYGAANAGMIIPKRALPRVKTDHLKTLINNFYKTLGVYKKDGGIVNHGGLARILEL